MIIDFLIFISIFILSCGIFFFLSILLHEGGHLIGGLISGYKFNSFRIGPVVWIKENDRVKFHFTGNAALLGQCLMDPPENESDFKYVLYNYSGGIVNIISGILIIVIIFALPARGDLLIILITLAFFALFLGITNVIPMKRSLIPNDGMNVQEAKKSPDAKHGFYLLLKTNALFCEGLRPRDLDPEILELDDQADRTNYLVANIVNLQASRLIDMGRYRDAVTLYEKIDLSKVHVFYRSEFKTDILYYFLIYDFDSDKAKDLYSDPNMERVLKLDVPNHYRVLSAYSCFIENDMDKARKYLEKAKNSIKKYPNKGLMLMENDLITALESKMNSYNKD